jgi:hypothetical protein
MMLAMLMPELKGVLFPGLARRNLIAGPYQEVEA